MNKVIQGDCLKVMKTIPDKGIDMVLTSPPYDNLRDYKGYSFNFEEIAKELYRILKDGYSAGLQNSVLQSGGAKPQPLTGKI